MTDVLKHAQALAERARAAERNGSREEALALYAQAFEMLGPSSTEPLAADVLRWTGTAHRERGEMELALTCYERSLALASSIGYAGGVAHATNCLAAVAHLRGDLTAAARLYDEAARAAARADDARLLGMVEQNLGVIANIRGDHDEALRRFCLSLHAFECGGDEEYCSWVLNNIGMLHADQGRHEAAARAYERALEIAQRGKACMVEAAVQLNCAELFFSTGQWTQAEEAADQAFALSERSGDRSRSAQALRWRAASERRRGDLEGAMRHLQEARNLAREAEHALVTAEILGDIGDLCRERGERERARVVWKDALAGFRQLGAVLDMRHISGRLAALPA